MKNSEFLLFFFIIYDVITTLCFIVYILHLIKINKKLENLLDDMNNELAKNHKK